MDTGLIARDLAGLGVREIFDEIADYGDEDDYTEDDDEGFLPLEGMIASLCVNFVGSGLVLLYFYKHYRANFVIWVCRQLVSPSIW